MTVEEIEKLESDFEEWFLESGYLLTYENSEKNVDINHDIKLAMLSAYIKSFEDNKKENEELKSKLGLAGYRIAELKTENEKLKELVNKYENEKVKAVILDDEEEIKELKKQIEKMKRQYDFDMYMMRNCQNCKNHTDCIINGNKCADEYDNWERE